MIRLATEADIPAAKRMARLFHEMSPYSSLPIDDDKLEDLARNALSSPTDRIMILSCQPEPVGMIVGIATEFVFNRQRIAAELAWWMDPEFRGSRDSIGLIDAYEYWATNIAKADIVQLSLLTTQQLPKLEKLYSRKGYTESEKSFFKVINGSH